jgi:two-component system phosphate regulon sensor histidine kinase PhoR
MKKLQTKITLTYFLFALATVLAIGIISSFSIESLFKSSTEKTLINDIDLVDYYLSEMPDISSQEIYSRVKAYAAKAKIRVTLIDGAGRVIIDSDVDYEKIAAMENHLHRPEIEQAELSQLGRDVRLSKSTGHEYMYVAKKIALNTANKFLQATAFLRVSYLLENVNAAAKELRWKIFTAGLLVLLLVLAISMFVSRRITNPLKTITADVNEIAQGNYEKRIDAGTNDEIHQLTESIHKLEARIVSDIAEMERLSKVRSQFLANVTHELKTPLFAIQAYLETLHGGAIDDASVNRLYLEKAKSNADRLEALLSDLIDISRIESKELKMSFRYFSIDELFARAEEEMKDTAAAKGIILHFVSPGSVKVLGDKERLLQVMSNLISNAILFNPEGTVVKVHSEKNDKHITVFVEDNGIGIAEEHLPRLFERFYRVDEERSRENGGTGLGLAIVKHLLEAHESSIHVESKPGEGTKFNFDLLCLHK